MRPNVLKTAEHALSRLEAGLDRQKMLLKRPASIRRDLSSSLPLCVAAALNDLVGGNGVTREVLCAREERKKTQGQKMDQMAGGKQRDEEEEGLPSTKSSIRP